MSKRRIVLDTNILISGLLFRSSRPQAVFDHIIQQEILLLSQEIYTEISQVLKRPKFDKYLSLEKRLAFLMLLLTKVEMIAVTEKFFACRDPKDNKFLELAVSGNANCLVTGDQDLLVLNPFRNVPIITVDQFLETLNQ
ncbi:putative toxin-antitoxin system toxin component, PIN family [Picosynechococcus sp. PCC 73109]|uniref:putative toxin-antitoxin system toxin component, PIN family n=1 Tax=Picosynechococcus sp. PCC 73109 TaxID=374982 RepID=UPI0007458C5E|nr:putative toxin-antitoxin system toxin component, PIN family [Picosynechococcus sp. PCC 73109]AMA10193.1 DNA-binding protein [Picosynechococcus sp. PCC 73109]